MKIAITDACIFIDLFDLQLMSEFFRIKLEVHTSLNVYNELDNEQKELLKAYTLGGKLTIHNLTPEELELIGKSSYPKQLSDGDKTVLYIAEKNNAIVLTSDKAVRNYSKIKSIESHGMLWIFDRLLDETIISSKQASEKLEELTHFNFFFRNNLQLSKEIDKRLRRWKKL